jgi:hypothetical protein
MRCIRFQFTDRHVAWLKSAHEAVMVVHPP